MSITKTNVTPAPSPVLTTPDVLVTPHGPGSTRAGIGYSENARSREAGAEAAREALQRAGIHSSDLVIMFSTSKHDPRQLIDGVRSVVGPTARIFGGFGDGVITNDRFGYDGIQVGVMAIKSASLQIDMFYELGLPDNEYNAGYALGQQIKQVHYAGELNLVLLYDTVKEAIRSGGLSINMAAPMVAGMAHALGTWPRTAGGALVGSLSYTPGYHWFDDHVERGGALALALSGNVRMDTVVLHGITPSSSYYTVTAAEGRLLLELDGRPAAEVVSTLIGPEIDWRSWPIAIVFGVNMGDPFGDYVDDNYYSRACVSVDEARGGLVMANDDLQVGMQVQLMRFTIEPDHMARRIDDLLAQVGDRRPLFAFYFDCAGRESRLATMAGAVTDEEEAAIVQRMLGPQIPLLGFYTAGEIAKSGPDQQVRALNITGVLSIFSEEC